MLTAASVFAAPEYFNAGALDTSSWSPSTNELILADAVVEHYCRYTLSDQRLASLTASNEVEAVEQDGTLTVLVPPRFDTDMPSRVDESFTLGGIPYSAYTRERKAFLQPYGDRMLRMLAVLHRPIDVDSGKAKPFTVYFNTDTGKVGTMWNIFSIIIYSPGPPYSFLRHQEHKGSPTPNSSVRGIPRR